MGQETRAGGLTFPIKLRCSTVSELCAEPGLEDPLVRALCRAFARARSSLPRASAFGRGVVLGAPELTTGGLAPEDIAALLARIGRAIERAAREQKLPLVAHASAARGPAMANEAMNADPRQVAAPFDRERFDPKTSTYLLPSYDGGRERVAVAGEGASPKFEVQETDAGLLINGILVFRIQMPDAVGAERRLAIQTSLAGDDAGTQTVSIEVVRDSNVSVVFQPDSIPKLAGFGLTLSKDHIHDLVMHVPIDEIGIAPDVRPPATRRGPHREPARKAAAKSMPPAPKAPVQPASDPIPDRPDADQIDLEPNPYPTLIAKSRAKQVSDLLEWSVFSHSQDILKVFQGCTPSDFLDLQDELGSRMAEVINSLDPFDAMMLGSLGPVIEGEDALNKKRFEYIVRTELDYGSQVAQVFVLFMFSRMYTKDIRAVLRLLAENNYLTRFIVVPGPDLVLMRGMTNVRYLPTEGKNQFLVADVGGRFHFRIFDEDGKLVKETDETDLTGSARQIEDLRKQVDRLWPPHRLTRNDKTLVIDSVNSILGRTQDTQVLREYLKSRGIKLEDYKDRDSQLSDIGRGLSDAFSKAMNTTDLANFSLGQRQQHETSMLPKEYQDEVAELIGQMWKERMKPSNLALGEVDQLTMGIPLGLYGTVRGAFEGVADIIEGDLAQGTEELLPSVILILTHFGGKAVAGKAPSSGGKLNVGPEEVIRGPVGAGQFELPGYRGPLDPGAARLGAMMELNPAFQQAGGLLVERLGAEGVKNAARFIQENPAAARFVLKGGMPSLEALVAADGDLVKASALLEAKPPRLSEGKPPTPIPGEQPAADPEQPSAASKRAAKQSRQVPDPKDTREASARLERAVADRNRAIETYWSDQTTASALEAELKELQANRPTRPAELADLNLRPLRDIENIEARIQALDKATEQLKGTSGLTPAETQYLNWLKKTWAISKQLEDAKQQITSTTEERKTLENVTIPRALSELRVSSQELKEILRKEGDNYGAKKTKGYDEILGDERWKRRRDDNLRAGKQAPRLAVDHLYSIDSIGNRPEWSEVFEVYKKLSRSDKALMIKDIEAIGDLPYNLRAMDYDANLLKGNKPWSEFPYDRLPEYGYTISDVDRMTVEESASARSVVQAIRDLAVKYKK
jgi:hypothetical protein